MGYDEIEDKNCGALRPHFKWFLIGTSERSNHG